MSSENRLPRFLKTGAAALLAALFPLSAPTNATAGDEVVDVELVLAVDVSLSMAAHELDIQRDGYAAALTTDVVINAIREGVHGKIAIVYMEWAGDTVQRIIVPWTVIASRADAEDFARRLTASPPGSARRTSISGGLRFAERLFDDSGFQSMKRVIDISGDGPNNQGEPVTSARDRIVAKGITINGLPLMTNGGLTSAFDVQDLDAYYTECVIGGPGAFMVPVNEWSQFPEAIRRKLVLELAGKPPADEGFPVVPAQIRGGSDEGYDCLIGEKRWMNRSWMWEGR